VIYEKVLNDMLVFNEYKNYYKAWNLLTTKEVNKLKTIKISISS
jgi:hypothetical protein